MTRPRKRAITFDTPLLVRLSRGPQTTKIEARLCRPPRPTPVKTCLLYRLPPRVDTVGNEAGHRPDCSSNPGHAVTDHLNISLLF